MRRNMSAKEYKCKIEILLIQREKKMKKKEGYNHKILRIGLNYFKHEPKRN